MNYYFKKWILYCAAGEFIGIASAGAIAYVVNHLVDEPETLGQKLFVLVSMLIAGGIEGTLLGTFQWNVLKEKLPDLQWKEWTGYTVLVAVLGWFLGMLPSLFFADQQAPGESGNDPSNNPFIFALLCIVMGLGVGCIFGLFQWFSLKRHVANAHQWIYANALGWGLGLIWIYIAASVPDTNTPVWTIVLYGMLGGAMAGISVGAVTGIFFKKLLHFS